MRARGRAVALAGLWLASEALYVALARLDAFNGLRPVLTFLSLMGGLFLLAAAAFAVVRGGGVGCAEWGVIAAGAVAFRLTLLPAGLSTDGGAAGLARALEDDLRGNRVAFQRFLLYDTDVWRYLWDGHAWAHGVNPFAHAPAEDAVEALADVDDPVRSDGRTVWPDIRDNVNHPQVPTIYPPLAQASFRAAHAIAPGSVVAMKGVVVAFDLLTGLLVAAALRAAGRPVAWSIAYLWNPLVVKVFAGSGHVDAVAGAALAALAYCAVRRSRAGVALTFALAVLAKLAPVVLAPFVARRIGWRSMLLVAGVLAVGYAPFVGIGGRLFSGLAAFGSGWEFNPGPYLAVERLLAVVLPDAGAAARGVCFLAFVGIAVVLWRRDDGALESLPDRGAWLLGALLVLSPAVMPWYLTWVLPLAVVAGQRVWVGFSALVCLAFLVMVDGVERPWVLGIEYGMLGALLVRERLAFAARTPGVLLKEGRMKRVLVSLAFVGLAWPATAFSQGSASVRTDPRDRPDYERRVEREETTVTMSAVGTVAEIRDGAIVLEVSGRHFESKPDDRTKFTADKKTRLSGHKGLGLADFSAGDPVKLTFVADTGRLLEVRLRYEKAKAVAGARR